MEKAAKWAKDKFWDGSTRYLVNHRLKSWKYTPEQCEEIELSAAFEGYKAGYTEGRAELIK